MENLKKSIDTSLINSNINGSELFQHQLIANEKGKKMISEIRRQLRECDEFYFSVAFITKAGTSMIIEELSELEKKGVKGYILTGLYLDFTEPAALKELHKYSNIEVKVSMDDGFHSKGYIFKKDGIYTSIIGSSNFTGNALTKNAEWNLKFSAYSNGQIVADIMHKFNNAFTEAEDFEDIIDSYEANYLYIKEKEKQLVKDFNKTKKIVPNLMQEIALKNLQQIREDGSNKALLVSATGTGKTYFAAFDVKEYNPQKCLFLVHRENIARSALKSFEKIIDNKKMGLYTGSVKEECDYQFSTIQTLTRDNHLNNFTPDEFDYIVIDEVHHVGAPTYQKIINYFKPKFLLGMTATPERGDTFNVFDAFDYNIASDIKLKDAMEMELLTPFRYFGITDIKVDGAEIDEKSGIEVLCDQSRVEHIIISMEKYGHSGNIVHGLIFVSRVEEARRLEVQLQSRGINAVALDGSNSEAEREETIKELEAGIVDYIITVDIFNEGIDIPCVNQVVLLRPTESAIVYIQQIGRGLRKSSDKEYVTIIDVIGNYKKSYNNIIALSQDRRGSKDQLKYFIKYGTDILFGESTISFDKITEDKIYNVINNTNFSTMDKIKTDYINLKARLGRVPMLCDFYNNGFTSPVQILREPSKYRTYYDVLKKLEEDIKLEDQKHIYIQYLSRFVTPAKRIHEWAIIEFLLENGEASITNLNEYIENNYNLSDQFENTKNAVDHLARNIYTSLSDLKRFPKLANINSERVNLSDEFLEYFNRDKLFRNLVEDLKNFNKSYYLEYYKQEGTVCVKLHGLYNKNEAHKYSNFDYNNGFQVSGYNINNEKKAALAFVTLDDSSSFTSYDNKIENPSQLVWFSKNRRNISRNGELTNEGKIAYGEIDMYIFVKRQSGEDFYYLGKVGSVENFEQIVDKDGNNVVKYLFNLENQIEERLYGILSTKLI